MIETCSLDQSPISSWLVPESDGGLFLCGSKDGGSHSLFARELAQERVELGEQVVWLSASLDESYQDRSQGYPCLYLNPDQFSLNDLKNLINELVDNDSFKSGLIVIDELFRLAEDKSEKLLDRFESRREFLLEMQRIVELKSLTVIVMDNDWLLRDDVCSNEQPILPSDLSIIDEKNILRVGPKYDFKDRCQQLVVRRGGGDEQYATNGHFVKISVSLPDKELLEVKNGWMSPLESWIMAKLDYKNERGDGLVNSQIVELPYKKNFGVMVVGDGDVDNKGCSVILCKRDSNNSEWIMVGYLDAVKKEDGEYQSEFIYKFRQKSKELDSIEDEVIISDWMKASDMPIWLDANLDQPELWQKFLSKLLSNYIRLNYEQEVTGLMGYNDWPKFFIDGGEVVKNVPRSMNVEELETFNKINREEQINQVLELSFLGSDFQEMQLVANEFSWRNGWQAIFWYVIGDNVKLQAQFDIDSGKLIGVTIKNLTQMRVSDEVELSFQLMEEKHLIILNDQNVSLEETIDKLGLMYGWVVIDINKKVRRQDAKIVEVCVDQRKLLLMLQYPELMTGSNEPQASVVSFWRKMSYCPGGLGVYCYESEI